MRFYRNNWFRIGAIFFVLIAFGMLFWGNRVSVTQRLLIASLMALLLHQYEEYEWPGGAPIVINRVFYGEPTDYRRYPGNWQSIMLVNTLAYIPYLAAIIWPTWYWLGIGTMFFNLFQFLGHAFKMNFGMKTWYNPGLATVIVLMMPISIAYWVHIWPIVGGWSWGLGIIALVVMLIVTVILPVQLLKSRTTDAVIPERQIRQFNWVKKAAAIRRN